MSGAPTDAAGPSGPGTFEVLDLLTGYQPAAAVTAAARLGVFDALATGPRSAAAVAAEVGAEPSATRSLLDALVGFGLLQDGGATGDDEASATYAATPAAHRLATDGDLRPVVEKEAFFARQWLDLDRSVRTGIPRLAPWPTRLAEDPAQARDFLRALVVLAETTGPALDALVRPGDRVADLGGGLGSYALPLAAAGARVDLLDLPAVTVWAAAEMSGRALRRGWPSQVLERVRVRAVDLLAVDAADAVGAEGFDVVLLSHLLHDLDDVDCAQVLRLAHQLARPGGRVVVFELPGDPPGAFGPLFDLMMRVETPGRARRRAELVDLVRAAGFEQVELSAEHPAPMGVVTGLR